MSLAAWNARISPAMISPTLKNCYWLKKLCAYSANDHFYQSFDVFSCVKIGLFLFASMWWWGLKRKKMIFFPKFLHAQEQAG